MMYPGNQGVLQEQDLQFIKEAYNFLENSTFLTGLMNYVGKPVDIVFEYLPSKARDAISRGTSKALQKALEWALTTMGEEAKNWSGRVLRNVHTTGAAVMGALSGAFGMPALLVERPITTMIMLRSIATVAAQNGENLADVHNRLECLQVFTLGSNKTPSDDEMESAYFTQRVAFAQLVNEAATFISRVSTKEAMSAMGSGTVPQVAHLLASVAQRFEIVISEKYLAETIPIVGAIGGASINGYFADYFGRAAHYHFGLRRLERQYGSDIISEAYKASQSIH